MNGNLSICVFRRTPQGCKWNANYITSVVVVACFGGADGGGGVLGVSLDKWLAVMEWT